MTQHSPSNTKRCDCVEMMHHGAARLREELAGKSLEEQAAYWRSSAEALIARQAEMREKMRKGQEGP